MKSPSKQTRIAIILKPEAILPYKKTLPSLTRWLQSKGKTISFLEKDAPRVQKLFNPEEYNLFKILNLKQLVSNSDLIITLGGDGTLIGTARLMRRTSPLPIFGINMGTLGFITEFSKKNHLKKLGEYFDNQLSSKFVNLFKLEIIRKDKVLVTDYFFNDAVISRKDIARMFTIGIESTEEHIANVSGDGLIISSPRGSTAYSLAAGGPIVHPEVKALILTPICPHSLNHRPLVIPEESLITLHLKDHEESIYVTLDGQVVHPIEHEDIISITKSPRAKVCLVTNSEKTYYGTLIEKFVHGSRGGKQ